MRYYLDDFFDIAFFDVVSKIRSEEYYINMMIAWYFATAAAKQFNAVISVFENKKLSVWVHNKARQKALESQRVTKEHKDILKHLKI